MSERLRVCLDGAPAAPTVRLSGEADLADADVLRAALDGVSGHVVLDCGGLTFCDVTALNTIIACGNRLREEGGSLTLRSASGSLRLALRVLGIGERIG